ncbi:MAG: PorV/PorQ family protein [Elusimicrobia bacterium]|nr:PorV/PorQ family protein [Elusimicrobiota bacterium]
MPKSIANSGLITMILAGLLLGFPLVAAAQALNGGQPGSFLHLGQSARAQGMGNCFVAISDDVTAIYYNPAGLTQLLKYELNTFYCPLWEDTNYNFLGYAHPLEKMGTFGVALINMTTGEFEKRETIISEPTNFTVNDRAFLFSYGHNFSNRLSVGTTVKSIKKTVDIYSGSAFGIDAGALYRFLGNQLSVGANFQNLMAPAPKLQSAGDKYPLYSKFGVAYKIESALTNWEDKLILALDVDYSSFLKAKNHFGIEYWYGKNLALRLGKDINNYMTFGMGVNYASFSFDYAAVAHDLGLSHRFSVGYRFGYIGEAQYSLQAIKEKVMALNQSGTELYTNKKYALALAEWDKALVWDPQNTALQEKVTRVNAELESIVNRKLIEQYLSKAYVLYEEGKLVDSMEQWKEVANLDPGNERAKEYIAKIDAKLAKEDLAILQEREKEKGIVTINAYIKFGDDLADQGRYAEAIREYQKVLRVNPEHLTANKRITDTQFKVKALTREHFDKAEGLYKSGDKPNAIKEFWLVLRLDPAYSAARDYLDKIKQEEKPVQVSKKIDEKKISQMYYRAADLYLKGQYQETIIACNELLAMDPTNENTAKLVTKAQSVLEKIGGK